MVNLLMLLLMFWLCLFYYMHIDDCLKYLLRNCTSYQCVALLCLFYTGKDLETGKLQKPRTMVT